MSRDAHLMHAVWAALAMSTAAVDYLERPIRVIARTLTVARRLLCCAPVVAVIGQRYFQTPSTLGRHTMMIARWHIDALRS